MSIFRHFGGFFRDPSLWGLMKCCKTYFVSVLQSSGKFMLDFIPIIHGVLGGG